MENLSNKTSEYIKHKPLQYGKKIIWSEIISEYFIKFIAFISIAIIIAIFYFVFSEAKYAFEDFTELNTDLGEEFVSETYIPEHYSSSESSEVSVDEQAKTNENVFDTERMMVHRQYKFKDFILPNDTIQGKPAYIWQPISEHPKFNFVPLFAGSLKLTIIGVSIAAPIAILAAIFTSMFAPKRLKELIKPAIEILAGFPSVVIGFFCLITLASVIQELFDTSFRLNAFVGGIGISLAVIPIIYTITEDSLAAVPRTYKEASLALGASLWQTAYRVVVPAALPGIFASVILGFGRAFGETMIALMATGNAALISTDIFEPVRTMSATIGAEMAEVEHHSAHYGILFLIGSLLFVITFSLNALAEFYVRRKLMKKFLGN